jgi:hypothetical protein
MKNRILDTFDPILWVFLVFSLLLVYVVGCGSHDATNSSAQARAAVGVATGRTFQTIIPEEAASVTKACSEDFKTYCNLTTAFPTDVTQLRPFIRSCVRPNRSKFSAECFNALMAFRQSMQKRMGR